MNAGQMLIVAYMVMQVWWRWMARHPHPPSAPLPVWLVAVFVALVVVVTPFVVRATESSPRLAHLPPARRALAGRLYLFAMGVSILQMLPRLATGFGSGTMPSEAPLWQGVFATVGFLAMCGSALLIAGEWPRGFPARPSGAG